MSEKKFSARHVYVRTEEIKFLIDYLEELGYIGNYKYDVKDVSECDTLIIESGSYTPCVYENVKDELSHIKYLDCGNEDWIFRRIAQIEDDVESGQYFVDDSLKHMIKVRDDYNTFEEFFNSYDHVLALKADGFHKASATEMYNYLSSLSR